LEEKYEKLFDRVKRVNGLVDEPTGPSTGAGTKLSQINEQDNVTAFIDDYFNLVRGPIVNQKLVSQIKAAKSDQQAVGIEGQNQTNERRLTTDVVEIIQVVESNGNEINQQFEFNADIRQEATEFHDELIGDDFKSLSILDIDSASGKYNFLKKIKQISHL
jgi:hypothetical protein